MRDQNRCGPFVAAVVVGILALAAPSARAGTVVLDFSSLNGTGFFTAPFVSQGFSLSSTGGFNVNDPSTGFFFTGTTGLAPILGSDVVLQRTDGGPFSLLSIDLARNFFFDTATFPVSFDGLRGSSVVVSQTFTVPGQPAPFVPVTSAFTGFTDLTSVTFHQNANVVDGVFQFTQITLAVPEPASLVLAGIGLLGGVLLRRRTGRTGPADARA